MLRSLHSHAATYQGSQRFACSGRARHHQLPHLSVVSAVQSADQQQAGSPVSNGSSSSPSAQSLFRAQLDFKFIKENLQLVTDNAKSRFSTADPARVVALYDQFTKVKQQVEALRAERNDNSNSMKVGVLVRPGSDRVHPC